MARNLTARVDQFMDLAARHANTHPWLVVVLMHEYFRNLYPHDPYIPFENQPSHLKRVSMTVDACIRALQGCSTTGSYFIAGPDVMPEVIRNLTAAPDARRDESETQQVYGRLWDGFDADTFGRATRAVIEERFGRHRLVEMIAGKTVLDMGCGSGRYTMALAQSGARRVVGVDRGRRSIENATRLAARLGVTGVEFEVADVLDLPFESDTFDFVFCNGVLHHTDDMERGIREMHRILKPGADAFLYLYGDGGLFWRSRKKMPQIMKQIPQEYAMAVLRLAGLPAERFPFVDNWYVPIERHVRRAPLERYLAEVGFSSLRKISSGRPSDLDSDATMRHPECQAMWGEGEHRYLMTKGKPSRHTKPLETMEPTGAAR